MPRNTNPTKRKVTRATPKQARSRDAAGQKDRAEAAERSATARRTYGLGERNPETLPDGSKGRETPHENERNTRRWNRARASVMASAGMKYTGHGG